MKTLVSVIAYNEEPNIRATIEDLRTHNCGFDIVVIDNGSRDATAAICRDLGVPVVSHCINTGGSMGTVTSYFNYTYHHGYDCLCQFDGDGQHLAYRIAGDDRTGSARRSGLCDRFSLSRQRRISVHGPAANRDLHVLLDCIQHRRPESHGCDLRLFGRTVERSSSFSGLTIDMKFTTRANYCS